MGLFSNNISERFFSGGVEVSEAEYNRNRRALEPLNSEIRSLRTAWETSNSHLSAANLRIEELETRHKMLLTAIRSIAANPAAHAVAPKIAAEAVAWDESGIYRFIR